jgi:hypothetical protein
VTSSLRLTRFSIGVGDRFSHQAQAQLQACILAEQAGVEVIPVWNKSSREHAIIGSEPSSTRAAADVAVRALGWTRQYFCDADHINVSTVDRFLDPCDFFTVDVADAIGHKAEQSAIDDFVARRTHLVGKVDLGSAGETVEITAELLRQVAEQFLFAVRQAGEVHRKIEKAKGPGKFVLEISMDETARAQTPAELLIILAAIADEAIPLQTIAPKFTGRFNKGVDYVGNVEQFSRELALDMAAIAYGVREFGLPDNLKLSLHSGSDKFSLYPAIYRTMKQLDAGIHLKTAGTTWLEELAGLAEAGGDGLELAKEIYAQANLHREELCLPYASVIDIDPQQVPSGDQVRGWSSLEFTSALRHNPLSPAYNRSFRQLLHVGFKIAAKMGNRFTDLLQANEGIIAKNVTENLYARHIAPVFLGDNGWAKQ